MVTFKNIIQVLAIAAMVSAAPSGKPSASITSNAASPSNSGHAVASQPVTVPPRPAKPGTTINIPPACTVCDSLGLACIGFCIAGGPLIRSVTLVPEALWRS
ncbi:hypothetical protein BGW37DRAFT_463521 [Umbelopsis sp. PMI_123]|nr:hypothetical protein BGW37DRAFT_463521 [Umbelopsis sp. PMI_123]